MKRKKINALLAGVLAFSMAFSQPMAVFATENTVVESNENSEDALTDEGENAEGGAISEDNAASADSEQKGDDVQSSNEEGNEAQTPDDGNENKDEEQTPDNSDNLQDGNENNDDVQTPDNDDESQNENGDDTQNPDDEDALQGDEENGDGLSDDDEIKVEAQKNGVSVEVQKKLNSLGFKTMILDQGMIMEKQSLSQVAKSMATMKAGEDYLEGEIVYFADSKEEAEKVAECYGGEVDEYSYGIAVADIEQAVMDAVNVAADVTIPIPAVYPNIIYTIADEWDTSSVDTSDITIEDVSEDVTEVDEQSQEASVETDVQSEDQVSAQSVSNQWHHGVINTVNAWGSSDASKGDGVTVAVLDTGVDYTHPDLAANIKSHTSVVEVSDGGSADGKDMNSHGTHCAGIIAALENNVGGVGVAPKAKISSIQVMNKNGSGNTAYTAKGLEAALAQDVDVISMSLGSEYYDAVLQKTIDKVVKKGIVVVAAAGNGDDLGYGTSQKCYPAACNNVIAVAATDEEKWFTEFSNYGTWVDIAAPGAEIYSTAPTYAYDSIGENGNTVPGETNYKKDSGTSMACPIVAGTVALMLANNKTLRDTNNKSCVDRITKDLIASADKDRNGAVSYYAVYSNMYYTPGDNRVYYPFVNVANAVYAVDDNPIEISSITFSTGEPAAKNVVKGGPGATFTLTAKSEHDKIYYTINGKKPTASTGKLYTEAVSLEEYSGKVKIQAVAVRGSKSSKVFSNSYTVNVAIEAMIPAGVDYILENGVYTAEMNVVRGKSIQLAVNTEPEYASNKKFDWTCSDTTNIKVNKTGKVTCNKKAEPNSEVVVTAKATDGSDKQCNFKIKVVSDMVDSLELNATSLDMFPYWVDDSDSLTIGGKQYISNFQLIPTSKGSGTSAQNTQYTYKSSNAKVASVDEDGNISAQAKGKAKITVTANDGSGKKAVCTVNVVTPVFDIDYQSSNGYGGWTGNDSVVIPIATGCSLKIKTVLNLNDKSLAPSDKKLTWTSSNTSMLTANNGTIKCLKTATPDTEISVKVTANTGLGSTNEEAVTIKFIVIDKVEKIYLGDMTSGDQIPGAGLVWNDAKVGDAIPDPMYGVVVKYGSTSYAAILKVKTASGKTYNLKDYLSKYNDYGLISVDVSNRDVVQNTFLYRADYEPGFYLVATKSGSAKVSYVLNDGSKKKFSLNVKVK